MNLTDAQLGRIARACAGRAYDEDCLWRAARGDLAGALELAATAEDEETPVMQVLREVAAEVAQYRLCSVFVYHGPTIGRGTCVERELDGGERSQRGAC